MKVAVCENHPRRTRVLTFTYIDADGVTYVSHYCPECAEEEADDEFYDWRPTEGGYHFEQPGARAILPGVASSSSTST